MKLFYYDELSPVAQKEARINIMIPEKAAHDERIAQMKFFLTSCKLTRLKLKAGYKVNHNAPTINTLINDRNHIIRISNGSQAIYKARRHGREYVARYARSNCAIFTESGEYVYYIAGMIETISKSQPVTPGSDEQRAFVVAYIEANERGPAYHDWLYRMHSKIRQQMIR